MTREQREMNKRRSQFNNTTRWLSDSAFTTYFGKPAFHTYGRGNTRPTVGGCMYGQTLLSHNINAECGAFPPPFEQVYPHAMEWAVEKTHGFRVPAIPRVESKELMSMEQIKELMTKQPIIPPELN